MTRSPMRLRRWLPVALMLALTAGLASAQSTPKTSDQSTAADPVVIRLGDATETLSDFEARFDIAIRSLLAQQGMTLTDQLRQQLIAYEPQYLDQRATEMVLLAKAKADGINVDQKHVDDVLQRIEGNVPKGQTLQDLLTSAGFKDKAQLLLLIQESDLISQEMDKLKAAVQVTDNALKSYYLAHKSDYTTPEQVCASHILLKTEADAQAVIKDLAGGADFAAEAKAKSTGPSGPQGGSLGCFGKGQMVKEFEDAAFAAPVGKVVGPVKTQYGYHVILVTKHTPATTKAFADVKSDVESKYRTEHANQQVQVLVKTSGIQTFPDLLPKPPATPPAGNGSSSGGTGTNGSSTGGSSSGGSGN